MVESVGAKPVSASDPRVAAVTRAATAPLTTPVAKEPAQTSVARQLAASPPVDLAHVATIKRAIAEGNFPISPATIADRLLALRLGWRSNDPA